MSNTGKKLKIEKACEAALDKFKKLGDERFAEVKSKLEYVLGSYRYDGNPVGLYEIGGMALNKLQELKKEKPRSVAKKLLDDLQKALKEQ